MASANALERERARVLEKQLAHSQELLVKAREELTTQKQQTTEQKKRTAEAVLLHKKAVIRHLQGQPMQEHLVVYAQKLRGRHQAIIEGVLAKRLTLPIHESADLGPSLEQAGYALKVVSPQELRIVSKRDGTRFSDAELRPKGLGLLEQLQEAVGQTRAREAAAQIRPPDRDIEMYPQQTFDYLKATL